MDSPTIIDSPSLSKKSKTSSLMKKVIRKSPLKKKSSRSKVPQIPICQMILKEMTTKKMDCLTEKLSLIEIQNTIILSRIQKLNHFLTKLLQDLISEDKQELICQSLSRSLSLTSPLIPNEVQESPRKEKCLQNLLEQKDDSGDVNEDEYGKVKDQIKQIVRLSGVLDTPKGSPFKVNFS
uniref:Uncharacterized protein n=1 Tax=Cruciviridae sp. TaxID=1955495 RepID=A0A1S6LVL2_9VIRU|nr:hypothetical protein [Cruciviridae sp.]